MGEGEAERLVSQVTGSEPEPVLGSPCRRPGPYLAVAEQELAEPVARRAQVAYLAGPRPPQVPHRLFLRRRDPDVGLPACQVRPWGTGLLPLAALFGPRLRPALGPFLPRPDRVGRGRFARGRGVCLQLSFEALDFTGQLLVLRCQGLFLRTQRLVLRTQVLDRAERLSQLAS